MFSSNASQVSTAATYIEDVFSTWLYTGNGSTQTITNGIDLSGNGGLVWIKNRTQAYNHTLVDTSRGYNQMLESNTTSAQIDGGTSAVSGFTSSGFALGAAGRVNYSGDNIVSWTFRKQAKFFDIQTFSGGRPDPTVPLSHNLGSVPGTIIVKRYDSTGPWYVYHRSLGATKYLVLNTTAAEATGSALWNDTNPTSTTFVAASALNASGATYVAYLFAHDAGGFGAAGTDNVISCGSFTTDGSGNATVSLGYEPQFVLIKSTSFVDSWYLIDVMRGMSQKTTNTLLANTSGAETAYSSGYLAPTATGFTTPVAGLFTASQSFIYIAIRRGPMKTPTSGTSVFSPNSSTSSAIPLTVTTNFPVDTVISRLSDTVMNTAVIDRLRGATTTSYNYLSTNAAIAETTGSSVGIGLQSNTTIVDNAFLAGTINPKIYWAFRRAPGFFDVVCYTGTGSNTTVNHNLGVAPELLIIKGRSLGGYNWITYYASSPPAFNGLTLNTNQGVFDLSSVFNNTYPTSSTFSLANFAAVNGSGSTYVAYLFATCPGVSKVGSYTGTGALQTINCGFTGGARFVLIKRTDGAFAGDWYVWDSARGISSGNDPYLLLNSTAAEVTGTNYVDTTSVGFQVTAAAPAGINASGGTYIFLAIA